MERKWLDKNLEQGQIDALTLFLFEESYKEYELILIYAYMQARTKDIKQFISYIYNLLDNGGYFIFDINTLYGFENVAQGILKIETQDDKFIVLGADFYDNILYTDITLFTKKGNLYQKEIGTIKQFYHLKQRLENILVAQGFRIEDVIDFYLHSEDQNDKQIFICKKRD